MLCKCGNEITGKGNECDECLVTKFRRGNKESIEKLLQWKAGSNNREDRIKSRMKKPRRSRINNR